MGKKKVIFSVPRTISKVWESSLIRIATITGSIIMGIPTCPLLSSMELRNMITTLMDRPKQDSGSYGSSLPYMISYPCITSPSCTLHSHTRHPPLTVPYFSSRGRPVNYLCERV
eukprot:sb/3476817/